MAVVMVVTFLAYMPVLDNGFVNWDDRAVLLDNYDYRGLDWNHIKWMFTTRLMCHFQPLTWLTYALDYKLWGMDPWGYHLTSLLWHAATAGMFFWVARRLLHLAIGRHGSGSGPGLAVAAGVAALVFAIHPLRAESVAWATERRDVTSGLFFMITLAAYLRAAAGTGRSRTRWLVVSLSAYVLSLMGKATGMTLPVVLVVLDAYPLGRLGPFGRGWTAPRVRGVWLEKLPYLVIAIVAGVNAFLGQYYSAAMAPMELVTGLGRVSTACYATAWYVYKTFLPFGLSPLYSPDHPFDPWAWYFLLSGVVVILFSTGVILAARRWPAGLALWITYLTLLGPVSGLVQIGPQIAADRYTYLPCVGWAILVAAGWLATWHRRTRSPGWKAIFVASTLVLLLALAGLGCLSRRQARIWHDSGTLWRHALRVHPENAKAHNCLANWLHQQGRLGEALAEHREGIRLNPARASSYTSMAAVLAELGQRGPARAAFQQAIEIEPRCFGAHNGLGRLLLRSRTRKEIQEGLDHLRKSLEIKPAAVQVRVDLATHYARRRQYGQAEQVLREGTRLAPRNPWLAANLAWLLATCPDPKIRNGPEAVTLARQACQTTGSSHSGMLDVLAAALAETGQFDQAVTIAGQAAHLAHQAGDGKSANAIERRASRYEAARPWRTGR